MNEVIEYIVKNGKKLVTAKELGNMFSLSGIEIRHIINEARSNGCPICSCRKGYYYSEDVEDIKRTVASLTHRITSIQHAVNGLNQMMEGSYEV